jgi:hypothetical protein
MKVIGGILVVLILVIVVWGTIAGSVDCGNKGGRYVPGHNGQMPMCVKEVK